MQKKWWVLTVTKKRLQKKVKKQEQEIYRLKGIILRTIVLCNKFTNCEYRFNDDGTRYAFQKLGEILKERLGEG